MSSVRREIARGAMVFALMLYFCPSIFSVFIRPTSAILAAP